MLEVWFIRHGECTANIGSATRTAGEAILTSRGRNQARCVADYLLHTAKRKPTRIITSLYQRAWQTAQYTCDYFCGVPFEIWPVYEFSYLALPGDRLTTPLDRLPLVKDFWKRCNPFYRHQNKAESFADLITRVQNVLNSLSSCDENEFIVIFSHQQFIQAVKWLLVQEREIQADDLQPNEMKDYYHMLNVDSVPNGAILKTCFSTEKQVISSQLEVSHLPDDLLLACARN